MAKDIFHDTVKLALQKDGWIITHDPYRLRYGIADIYIDLKMFIKPFYASSQLKL